MEDKTPNITYVLVDCVTMPETFKVACELASPVIDVRGFAGADYSGYRPQYNQHAQLNLSDEEEKDSAIMSVFFESVFLFEEAPSLRKMRVVIVTKHRSGPKAVSHLKKQYVLARLINTDGDDLAALLQNS